MDTHIITIRSIIILSAMILFTTIIIMEVITEDFITGIMETMASIHIIHTTLHITAAGAITRTSMDTMVR